MVLRGRGAVRGRRLLQPLLECRPSGAAVLLAVAAVEGGMVLDGTLEGTVGQGVVHDRACYDAISQVPDVLPAEGDADLVPPVGADAVASFALPLLARQPDSDKTSRHGEDDATVTIILGVALVLVEDGKLDAVDGAEFVEREAEELRGIRRCRGSLPILPILGHPYRP